MKIATFNVNSIRKRLDIIHGWIRRNTPDVLCLQETKVQDAEFPLEAFADLSYSIHFCGEKSYNGVAMFSRIPPDLVSFGFQDGKSNEDPTRLARIVVKGIPIINTYIPQGYAIDSPKYVYKLQWFQRLKRYFSRELLPGQTRYLVWGYECRSRTHRCAQSGKTPQACMFSRRRQAGLSEYRVLGFCRCVSASLPQTAAVHVLGLPSSGCVRS